MAKVHFFPMKARGLIYLVGATQEAQGKLTGEKEGTEGRGIKSAAGNRLHGVIRKAVGVWNEGGNCIVMFEVRSVHIIDNEAIFEIKVRCSILVKAGGLRQNKRTKEHTGK